MGEVIVRKGAIADLPALGAVERDAGELYRSVGYDFCADGPVTGEDELRDALAHGAVLVAEHAGRPVGFALVEIRAEPQERHRALARGWAVTRTARLSRPPVSQCGVPAAAGSSHVDEAMGV